MYTSDGMLSQVMAEYEGLGLGCAFGCGCRYALALWMETRGLGSAKDVSVLRKAAPRLGNLSPILCC